MYLYQLKQIGDAVLPSLFAVKLAGSKCSHGVFLCGMTASDSTEKYPLQCGYLGNLALYALINLACSYHTSYHFVLMKIQLLAVLEEGYNDSNR